MNVMATYEIKTDHDVFTLEGMDAVEGAVRAGKIGRAVQIREVGQKEWVRVDATPGLAGLFAVDVWDAWVGETDATVLDAFQEAEPTRVAQSSQEQLTRPTADEVQELPAASVEPVGEELPASVSDNSAPERPKITPAVITHPAKPRRPAAKVIAFPAQKPAHTQGVHALKLEGYRQPKLKASARGPGGLAVRWGPIVLIGAVGAGAMMLWVWYININAGANFVDRRQGDGELVTAAVKATIADKIEPLVSPYDTLEDATREQMMEGILDIPGETEFEDALLIELRRVRVDVRSVRVKIESWTGRKNDIPAQVSFNLKVVVRDGELDRDLGALGMVMGKYIQHYGLQVNTLNIILGGDDGLRKLQMNPESARRYFTHRLSMERFLSTAFDAQ